MRKFIVMTHTDFCNARDRGELHCIDGDWYCGMLKVLIEKAPF